MSYIDHTGQRYFHTGQVSACRWGGPAQRDGVLEVVRQVVGAVGGEGLEQCEVVETVEAGKSDVPGLRGDGNRARAVGDAV